MLTSWVFWAVVALSVAIYWLLPRGRDLFLFLFSAAFIATIDWLSAVCLFGFCTLAYVSTQKLGERRPWLSVVTAFGVGAFLTGFKYVPPAVVWVAKQQQVHLFAIAVPLGASYFTFKLIHYVIECRRKHIPPHEFSTFLAYMFFLPMFAAGPIERFEDFLKNRTDRIDLDAWFRGGTRIAYGLVKKFVLVDLLTVRRVHESSRLDEAIPLLRPAYSAEELYALLGRLRPLVAWQFVINHYVAWYLDFSAYCDIAIGIGLFFGVTLVENFEWPFLSTNIGDFWRRYHISLSNWCQRYVYFPVLGSTRNALVALFCSMITMGLWHAGNLNYLAWGLYQATLLALYQVYSRYRRRRVAREEEEGGGLFTRVVSSRPYAFAGGLFTFLAVCASAAFPSMQAMGIMSAARVFAALFGVHLSAHL